MAFITGLDVFDPKNIGVAGNAIVGSQRHLYYTLDADVTNYNVADPASTWNEIHLLDKFDATSKTNKIEIYDNNLLVQTLQGKTSSTLTITQNFAGYLNSVGRLNGKSVWFAEAYTDARDPKETNGNIKIFEYRLVDATFTGISEEKGDAEAVNKITLDGSYNVSTQKRMFRGITPISTVLTPTAGNTATVGTPKVFTVSASDFIGGSIDLTSLVANTLMGEIASIDIVKKSGTPTMVVSVGANDSSKSITFTGTGTIVLNAKIVTINSGTWLSPDCSITVS